MDKSAARDKPTLRFGLPQSAALSTIEMNHEEYVEFQKQKVAAIAKGMLDGTINYLEGAVKLSSLRHAVEVPEDDPDFIAFVAVASEIDHLPIGKPRQFWSKEALDKHEPEIQESIIWAK